MLFHCHRVQANFPGEKLGLVNREQAKLLWDEHGGTFVLRVEGLEAVEVPEAPGEAGVRLEFDLPEPASLARRWRISPGGTACDWVGAGRRGVSETAILVACHTPGK